MTTKRRIRTAALLALATMASSSADAQAPADRRELRQRDAQEHRETLGVWFIHRLRTQLDLSKEQTLELLPHVDKIEAARAESARRRREIATELETIWHGTGELTADVEDRVTSLMRALDEEDQRARATQNELRDQMLAVLDARQRAGFVLFANGRGGQRQGRTHRGADPP